MVEPVTHTSVPGIAPRATTVEQKQGQQATQQDRDVRASKEDAELNKDKEREHRRLEALEELHEEILAHAGNSNAALRIEEDTISGRTIYQAVDKDSGEVLKQFPAEEILKSVRFLRFMTGMMVDRKA